MVCFRSMSYWMVLKRIEYELPETPGFRSMSYWMVLKHKYVYC